MNRTQKKCFIAATGLHLLLLVILVVGPGFLSTSRKADDLPVLQFIPMMTTDKPFSGGGTPNANPPPPQADPTPPQPTPLRQQQAPAPTPKPPEPKPVQKVEETPEPPKTAKTDTAIADKKPDPQRKIQINTKVVSRSDVQKSGQTSTPSRTDTQNTSREFSAAANNIRKNASSSTKIEMPGPGGGGPTYANFLQAVKSIYANAWIVPDGVTDDEAVMTASVTIARDGTVISGRLIKPSGNSLADQSVDTVLRRIKRAVPLPADTREEQRTVTITFSVKAQRGLG
jgi:TonB family protein